MDQTNESQKRDFIKFAKILVIILIAFVAVKTLASIKSFSYIGRGTPAVNVITVSGKGEVMAKPDIADFTFTVSEEGKTAKEAQDKATAKSNAALDAVKAAGVDDKDVKTVSYDLSPKYEYQNVACPQASGSTAIYCPPGRQIINGYTVNQSVEVKVRKIDDASPLLTKITAAGVSNISGINFVVDDQDALTEQAKALAITDAKTKAEALAKQLGVSLARIVSFSDDQGGPIYYAKAYATDSVTAQGASMPPTPQLPTGENKITSNVSITYEIK